MNSRIKEIRKSLGLSQDEFAQKIGLARNSVASYEIGRRAPMEQTIKSICREYNVNYDWLKYGIGEMFSQTDTSTMAAIDAIMTGEDEFAKNIFKEFANLSKEEWILLQKLINKFAKK